MMGYAVLGEVYATDVDITYVHMNVAIPCMRQ